MNVEPAGSEPIDATKLARSVIDTNFYLTLATADEAGTPWASPVWYAHADYTEFVWISRPQARHSRNLAVRPGVGIVIFDSTAGYGHAQAVYVEADAAQVPGSDLARYVSPYSRRSVDWGSGPLAETDIVAPAQHRMYRAVARAHFVLQSDDRRLPVQW